ncbi:hypothetical protein ACFU7T_34990 [Streptomyces sp. NPDC057555]|uniref:hypothetical protein n=1 Tax=Streptomyces sp. NPDC057555 TaxID=3346166 RepID=UPI00367A7BDB
MPLQNTTRRAIRRLVQLYSDAAKANASQDQITLATGPFGTLDETRRAGEDHHVSAGDRTGTRHG